MRACLDGGERRLLLASSLGEILIYRSVKGDQCQRDSKTPVMVDVRYVALVPPPLRGNCATTWRNQIFQGSRAF